MNCGPLTCLNGGMCQNTDSGYKCLCRKTDTFSGPRCVPATGLWPGALKGGGSYLGKGDFLGGKMDLFNMYACSDRELTNKLRPPGHGPAYTFFLHGKSVSYFLFYFILFY